VEEGKAILKKSMDNTDDPPRFFDKAGIAEDEIITDPDILLLDNAYSGGYPLGVAVNRPLNDTMLGRLGITGHSGTLTVRIYDMQYDPENVNDSALTTDGLNLMPPSVIATGADDWRGGGPTTFDPDKKKPVAGGGGGANNTGVYLIRATLNVNGAVASTNKMWMLDTAIIQSNNM
jgi:hypothetical protein